VELSINGKLIGRGEVVVVEDRFGIKITEVIGGAPPV
jgi:flagellar motor switch/type III secretory pathway protein FliN